MGILYTVWPLDQQMRAWLESEGVPAPTSASRWPTDAEVRNVLRDLSAFKVTYTENGRGSVWDADVQSFESEELRTLLHADPDGGNDEVTKLSFEKGAPLLIVAILRALSVSTGPLVLMADAGGPPLVVSWAVPFRQLVEEFCELDESAVLWSTLASRAPGAQPLQ